LIGSLTLSVQLFDEVVRETLGARVKCTRAAIAPIPFALQQVTEQFVYRIRSVRRQWIRRAKTYSCVAPVPVGDHVADTPGNFTITFSGNGQLVPHFGHLGAKTISHFLDHRRSLLRITRHTSAVGNVAGDSGDFFACLFGEVPDHLVAERIGQLLRQHVGHTRLRPFKLHAVEKGFQFVRSQYLLCWELTERLIRLTSVLCECSATAPSQPNDNH
jgi:hypothetical protein